MRWLTTLTLAPIAALGLSAPLAAYDLPADATEMETALYGVLEKHCSRCHQDGALKEGLAGAKSRSIEAVQRDRTLFLPVDAG